MHFLTTASYAGYGDLIGVPVRVGRRMDRRTSARRPATVTGRVALLPVLDFYLDLLMMSRDVTVATGYTRKSVSGGISKRIGREYKGRNHDSDPIELKIS